MRRLEKWRKEMKIDSEHHKPFCNLFSGEAWFIKKSHMRLRGTTVDQIGRVSRSDGVTSRPKAGQMPQPRAKT
jgi:hypothetical protein